MVTGGSGRSDGRGGGGGGGGDAAQLYLYPRLFDALPIGLNGGTFC